MFAPKPPFLSASSSRSLPGAARAFLFLAGFIVARYQGGTEPILTYDTMNDAKFVHTCLGGACTFSGMGTSVGFIVHGANYLHLKTFAAWLGLNERWIHFLLQVCHGLGASLTWEAVSVLVGPEAAALAVPLYISLASLSDLEMRDTYNHRLFPFLDALILALMAKGTLTGKRLFFILSGAIAALTTNIHVRAATSILAVAAVSFLHQFRTGVLVLITVTAVCFFTSPATWVANLSRLAWPVQGGFATRPFSESLPSSLALMFSILWLAALPIKKDLRQTLLFPLLVLMLRIGAMMLAGALGFVAPDDKYLLDALPALALLIAASPFLLPLKADLRLFLCNIAPYAGVTATIVCGIALTRDKSELLFFTPSEVNAVAHYLRDELHLSPEAAVTALREPHGSFLAESIFPAGLPDSVSSPPTCGPLVLVLKVRPKYIPSSFGNVLAIGEN